MSTESLRELNPKIKSYLGFAVKSGKAVIGADNILKISPSYAVLVDKAISENTLKKITQHCKPEKVFIVDNLAELTFKSGVKAIAVRDLNLANAIIECFKGANLRSEIS